MPTLAWLVWNPFRRLSLVNLKKLGFTAANMFIDNHLKYYRTKKAKEQYLSYVL